MGWRFRRSFKVIPGVKLNLSKTGLSASFGGAPLTLNVGTRGVYGTASLPGTGISFRQRFTDGSEVAPAPDAVTPQLTPSPTVPVSVPLPAPDASPAPIEEIRSASTECLTSESLTELKRVLQTAYEEHEDISSELETARQEQQEAQDKYQAWENGFLFKKMFKESFAKRKADLDTADAKVEELEQQLHLTTVSTHVEIAKEQAEPYFRMRDEFASLSECAAIWDIKTHQAADKFRERTTAETHVSRERVTFSLGSCDLIQWKQKVPHLQNANGGDLFLYPGFILYRAAREAFSVIDFHDVNHKCNVVPFHEDEVVPTDAKVMGRLGLRRTRTVAVTVALQITIQFRLSHTHCGH